VLARDSHRRARFPREPRDAVGVVEERRQQEFDRDLVIEFEVTRRHDGAHSADAEHPIDAVFARDDRAFGHSRRRLNFFRHAAALGKARSEVLALPAPTGHI